MANPKFVGGVPNRKCERFFFFFLFPFLYHIPTIYCRIEKKKLNTIQDANDIFIGTKFSYKVSCNLRVQTYLRLQTYLIYFY